MIALNRNGVYIAAQTLPRVAVLKVTGTDAGGDALAVPINWQEDREPPLIFVNPARTSRTSPGVGDRVLARLTRAENDTAPIISGGWRAGHKQFLVFLAKTGAFILSPEASVLTTR